MAIVSFARYFKPSLRIKLGSDPTEVQTLAGVLDPTTIDNFNGTGIRVRFRVRKTITSSPNTADIDIFNMDQSRIADAVTTVATTGRSPITIYVGYDNTVSRIFSGDIKRLDSRLIQLPDIITRMSADDSGDEIDDAHLALSAPFASVDQLLNIALKAFETLGKKKKIKLAQSTLEIIKTFKSKDKGFPLAHVGKTSEIIDEAARLLEARWWIDDGELHMSKLGRVVDGMAVVLDKDRLFSDIAQDRNGFVRFRTFCDPNIIPGRQIQIDSSVYRVHMVEYTGDTFGGSPWTADVVAWDSFLPNG